MPARLGYPRISSKARSNARTNLSNDSSAARPSSGQAGQSNRPGVKDIAGARFVPQSDARSVQRYWLAA